MSRVFSETPVYVSGFVWCVASDLLLCIRDLHLACLGTAQLGARSERAFRHAPLGGKTTPYFYQYEAAPRKPGGASLILQSS